MPKNNRSTPSHVQSADVSQKVAATIAGYNSKKVHPAVWALIASFVRDVVTRFRPSSVDMAERTLYSVALFTAWGVAVDIPLDVEALFLPDLVDRFMQMGLPGVPENTRGTHRSHLNAVGPVVTHRAPWPPRPIKLARKPLTKPYADPEIAAWLHAAKHQSTAARARACRGLLCLGLGAGLRPGEHLLVTGSCITQQRGIAIVDVPGQYARRVAIRQQYMEMTLALAAEFPDQPLVGWDTGSKNRLNQLIARVDLGAGLPRLSAARLRSTWITALIAAGVRLPEFMAAAGVVSSQIMADLVPFVPPLDDDAALRMIAGVDHD